MTSRSTKSFSREKPRNYCVLKSVKSGNGRNHAECSRYHREERQSCSTRIELRDLTFEAIKSKKVGRDLGMNECQAFRP